MYQQEINIRVRYAETDQMGFVYYGNYATYYEVARVEALRKIGFSYNEMELNGVGMPVIDLHTKYHQPARYDDLLTVKLTIAELPKARIVFNYEVTNPEGKLINSGETTLVFMNMKTMRPVKMPNKLAELLKPYFD